MKVQVKPPFSDFFPDTYEVEEQLPSGICKIAGGVDFAPEHLIFI